MARLVGYCVESKGGDEGDRGKTEKDITEDKDEHQCKQEHNIACIRYSSTIRVHTLTPN